VSTALKLVPAPHSTAVAARDVAMIFGYTTWGGAVRRGMVHSEDRLTLELMDSPRVGRLLVCNPYRSALATVARSVIGPREAAFPATDTRSLYQPLRLRRSDPTALNAIERSCAAYEARVRRACERAGLRRPAIITTHPLLAGFGKFDWAGSVTYYATDDLSAHPPLRAWWPAYPVAHARVRELGRRVIGVSAKAAGAVDPIGGVVIPNGIEPDEWLARALPPSWFTALPGPRLLYVGTLDPRVEVESLRALAQAYPTASVVLVGRCPDPEHYAPLRALRNVTIAAPVARTELRALVGAADVGLIPHVRDEQTEAMSPLKLYEYLAAGLPVAATDLPPIRPVWPGRTALAHGPTDFPAAVARALELGRCAERDRIDFIHANAWERRFELLLDIALERP
jgi:teichuronic acid biosynthesis glycosyltransferase TuaH